MALFITLTFCAICFWQVVFIIQFAYVYHTFLMISYSADTKHQCRLLHISVHCCHITIEFPNITSHFNITVYYCFCRMKAKYQNLKEAPYSSLKERAETLNSENDINTP